MTKKKLIGQPHDYDCAACDLQDTIYKEIGFYSVMVNNLRLFNDRRVAVKEAASVLARKRLARGIVNKLWGFYNDAVGLCKHGQLMERE